MSDLVFLKALRDKLKGGNSRSIHLNVLPGRFVSRLDLANLNDIQLDLSRHFLKTLLTKGNFEFKISFDNLELNIFSGDQQKKLGLFSKRLNSLYIENEDNFKEHGIKTFGFGYPVIVKRSRQDPTKIIKAPLFIWPLEIIKSYNKVNEWSILRNKIRNDQGKIIDDEIHSVGLNEVFLSFIKTDENINIPQINEELLEDAIIDEKELIDTCIGVLKALNVYSSDLEESLQKKFRAPIDPLPDAKEFDAISNNTPWIHFGGVLGLYRTQKESIITDIDRLIERHSEFAFEDLKVENFSGTPFSAIQTDPTQQEILSTLGIEPKKIIQGPPGTGKSQSLTALITNALANGKKCLVVCEKKTALEVIKQNLLKENEQLGNLAAVIEDISKDRDSIVNSVRERMATINMSAYYNDVSYQSASKVTETLAGEINIQHKELDYKIYQGKNWTELVGDYLKHQKKTDINLVKNKLDYSWFSFSDSSNELAETSAILREAKKLYAEVSTLDHPLDSLNDTVFNEQNYTIAKLNLEKRLSQLVDEINELSLEIHVVNKNLKSWEENQFNAFPEVVRNSLNGFLKYLQGYDCIDYPEEFVKQPIEQTTAHHVKQLEKSEALIKGLLDNYQKDLRNHFEDYFLSVKQVTDDYISFAENGTNLFGTFFLKNDGFSKLVTNIGALVSGKYKSIKQGREELVSRILSIKYIQEAQPYLTHSYPTGKIEHLQFYIDNIQNLNSSAVQWYETTPSEIETLLSKVTPNNLHAIYKDQRETVNVLLAEFNQTNEAIEENFDLDKSGVEELNNALVRMKELQKSLLLHTQYIEHFRDKYNEYRRKNIDLFAKVQGILEPINEAAILNEKVYPGKALQSAHHSIVNLQGKAKQLLSEIAEFRNYFIWRIFLKGITEVQKKTLLGIIESNCEHWDTTFECWYLNWLLSGRESNMLPKSDDKILEFIQAKIELRNQQVKSILSKWNGRQQQSLRDLQRDGLSPTSLYNKKGKKGERRNSLRKIINSDFDLFTDFFPVMMVSPTVCSSILPLIEGLFDIIIFDEASQLRLEDTFPALIRGKIKIVSGDSQQMPPSSYFMGGIAILNPGDDESEEDAEPEMTLKKNDISLNLADSESLLAYAENRGYKQSYLKVHYRSHHPALIDFSNHAFYGKRLMPMPARTNYVPIHFIPVNGLYEDQVNRDEARQVVEILLKHIKPFANGKFPSVGIATFNIYQRNLILEEIMKVRQLSQEFDKKISDLGSDLFVKNLENIQGDERDIIIISTTFGKKSDGSFRQNFGPIIQANGYKLLNVIVTRAKYKIFVCSSIPTDNISQYFSLLQQMKNNGRAVFYAYLAYAKAISAGDSDTVDYILKQLYDNCESKVFDIEQDAVGSESPFEEEVYYRLAEQIGQDRIQQQYKIGGFRLDMVVRSERTGLPIIAIECDGARYHSSNEAYAWDVFRQNQVEQFGFVFIRIWSTNWWYSPEKEVKKLVDFIHAEDLKERNTGSENYEPIYENTSVEPVTLIKDAEKRVRLESTVTVKTLKNEILIIRFSRNEKNSTLPDSKGILTVYQRSPIALALIGRKVGEVCQLGMLEVYYKIEKIETPDVIA